MSMRTALLSSTRMTAESSDKQRKSCISVELATDSREMLESLHPSHNYCSNAFLLFISAQLSTLFTTNWYSRNRSNHTHHPKLAFLLHSKYSFQIANAMHKQNDREKVRKVVNFTGARAIITSHQLTASRPPAPGVRWPNVRPSSAYFDEIVSPNSAVSKMCVA